LEAGAATVVCPTNASQGSDLAEFGGRASPSHIPPRCVRNLHSLSFNKLSKTKLQSSCTVGNPGNHIAQWYWWFGFVGVYRSRLVGADALGISE